MGYEVKIVADSISECGARLTTFALKYPRFILAEINTHRLFSRSSASSRAIPVKTMLENIKADPVLPLFYGKNQKGMQAKSEEIEDKELAEKIILELLDDTIAAVKRLNALGLAKQSLNRLVENFSWTSTVITATEWTNFYNLRCSKMAQPEMEKLARMMREAHEKSVPVDVPFDDWHLPFIKLEEYVAYATGDLVKASVARCARVSYNNHDGSNPDIEKDIGLYERLLTDLHLSPLEHVATPLRDGRQACGNFIGWQQLRKQMGF
jgi:thymidylate synthase ThyX